MAIGATKIAMKGTARYIWKMCVCMCVRVLKYTRDAILYAAQPYIHTNSHVRRFGPQHEKSGARNEMKILLFAGGAVHPRNHFPVTVTRQTEQMSATQFVSRQRRGRCRRC